MAVKTIDTIKKVDAAGFVTETPERKTLWVTKLLRKI